MTDTRTHLKIGNASINLSQVTHIQATTRKTDPGDPQSVQPCVIVHFAGGRPLVLTGQDAQTARQHFGL